MPAEEAAPYTASAPIYDHMMREVDYVSWAAYLAQLLKMSGIDIRRSKLKKMELCELACGTGNISLLLSRLGFRVTGVDSSKEMLAVAESKVGKRTRNRARFLNYDMTQFESASTFDVEVCVYDSINYIPTKSLLSDFFKIAHENLKDGGAFVLDASLEPNSLNENNLFTQKGRHNGLAYERRSSYDRKSRIHTTIVRVGKNGKVYEEAHHEYVYDLDLLRKLISAAGFREKLAVGDFTYLEADNKTERVHFVLLKQP